MKFECWILITAKRPNTQTIWPLHIKSSKSHKMTQFALKWKEILFCITQSIQPSYFQLPSSVTVRHTKPFLFITYSLKYLWERRLNVSTIFDILTWIIASTKIYCTRWAHTKLSLQIFDSNFENMNSSINGNHIRIVAELFPSLFHCVLDTCSRPNNTLLILMRPIEIRGRIRVYTKQLTTIDTKCCFQNVHNFILLRTWNIIIGFTSAQMLAFRCHICKYLRIFVQFKTHLMIFVIRPT